jgi:predicted heme/steroid binding protein
LFFLSHVFGAITVTAPSTADERQEAIRRCREHGERLLSAEQLRNYDGSETAPGVYLAFMGKVYDVEKGRKHYGPGGSYSMFAAKDASRAYLSGDFSESELNDKIDDLPKESYSAIREWSDFYKSEYEVVGKLIGRFYDDFGCATAELSTAMDLVEKALQSNQEQELDDVIFPPCNSEWKQSESVTRVWCTETSGGPKRDWVGKPRRLFLPKFDSYRCACVKDFGLPTVSSIEYTEEEISSNPLLSDSGAIVTDSGEVIYTSTSGSAADSTTKTPIKSTTESGTKSTAGTTNVSESPVNETAKDALNQAKDRSNKGDLNHPRISEIVGCDPQAIECFVTDLSQPKSQTV